MKFNVKYRIQRVQRKSLYRLYKVLWSIFTILSCVFFSCEDFVAIDPPKNELVSETVYTNDETATAAIRGIYRELISTVFASGPTSITFLGGLSADELDDFQATADNLGFYDNELIAENGGVNSNWGLMYKVVYQTNAVLKGLENSTEITPEIKELLEGEARCIRAFSYFYLVNLWGEVPLITGTDFEENRLASRVSISQVYELIVSDLKRAKELLPEDYAHAGEERVRVNKGAATALLGRVYLYLEDWNKAETQATEVIENPLYVLEGDLNKVFLRNSIEAIWQLKPTLGGHTRDGNIFILTAPPNFAALSGHVINAFETGDERKANWTESFTNESGTWNYPFKYKVKSEPNPDNATEYTILLRLAEQYLIRAEARAQQGNISGAQEDLNTIRKRAGLGNTAAATQVELLDALLQERRVELFTEWGHRWLDLKRINRSGAVLGPIKTRWQPTDVLWPIPQSEIDNNPNLTQNGGY